MSKSDNTLSLPNAKWESDLSIMLDAKFWTQICKIYILHAKKCQPATHTV